MKVKKKPEDHLPQKAPKKTGKKGIGPLDPEKDFSLPVKKAIQSQLLEIPESEKPAILQAGKCVVHFVKFSFDRDTNRDGIALMDFSLFLEDKFHKGLFPREVEEAWMYLKRGNVKRIDANGIPRQNVTVSIAPEGKPDLALLAAEISKATVSAIVAKGKGKQQKLTRLQFRVLTRLDAEVAHFCEHSFDESVWITVKETQQPIEWR